MDSLTFSALIGADGVCINALATLSQAALVAGPGEHVVTITAAQFYAGPVGKAWTGTEFVEPA